MPATRLQPLPFPEPERFISYIEEDPSLLEPGLRIVARHLPLPAAGVSVSVDLLALDAAGRVTAIDVRPAVTGRVLEAAAASRAWIRENLPTLKALCPTLAAAGGGTRSLLIGGRIDPSAESLLSLLAPPRPEIVEASIFDSPGGPAVCLRPVSVAPAAHALSEPMLGEPAAAVAHAAPPGADPLSGIPLTAEEVAEFRRLATAHPARAAGGRGKGAAPAGSREEAAFPSRVEN